MYNTRLVCCIGIVALTWLVAPSFGQSHGVDLSYDEVTGEVVLQTPDDVAISVIRIGSRSGVFNVARPDFTTEHNPPEYEVRLIKGTYQDVSLSNLLPSGLTADFLRNDLCAYGFTTGGDEIRGISVLGGGALPQDGCNFPRKASGHVDNALVLLNYTPATGELAYEIEGQTSTGEPALLTTLQIQSRSKYFTGDPVPILDRLFEVDRDDKLFLMRPEGVGPLSFGNAVRLS